MLSICRVAGGGEEYYLSTAAPARDHSEGLVEPAGVWLGGGAGQLGLSGPAEAGAVRHLLRGVDPASGRSLLEAGGRRRIAAFDCTFSAPKSVSLVQAFSPDETVREEMRLGHEAAVRASLGYFEQQAGAVRLSGVDGRRVVRGDLVGVGFLHRLSRAGDPHLHTHVLIANLVPDRPAGNAHPLDATGLFLECRTAGALYETHLRHELTTRLGVEWQPLDGRCWSDLKGLDPTVIRRFSQRSAQIEAGLAAVGWQGGAARRAMAELTRPAKEVGRTYEEAIEAARPRLWQAGVSERRLRDVCHRLSPSRGVDGPWGGAPDTAPQPRGEGWRDETLQRLPARSVDGTFTLRDVIRARCSTAPSGRTVAGVQEDARALLTDGRVLGRGARVSRLRGGATGSIPVGGAEALYTTKEIAAAEEAIVRALRSMASARPGSVTVAGYEAGRRFEALDALSAAAAAWRDAGRNVLAVAPGRWAAAGIESSCGIDTVVVPGVAREGRRQLPGSDGLTGPATSPPSDRTLAGASIGRHGVVVVAGAQAYGPAALNEIVRVCSAAQASVVLFAPNGGLEQRELFVEVARGCRGGLPAAASPRPVARLPAPSRRHVFASVDVTLVSSLGEARDEAVRRLRDGRHEALVVTGDDAVVAALRAGPGVEPGDVVHTRELKGRLAESAGEPPGLIVVGGASVLRQGATAGSHLKRSHIVVAPGIAPRSPEGVGRAAEAARTGYLIGQLGRPAGTPEARRAWRAAATTIEAYRQRFQITDARHAFGGRSPSPGRSADQALELAAARRQAGEVREMVRGRSGRGLEAPSRLGLGR